MKTITVDIGGTNIQYAVIKENDELDYFHEYITFVSPYRCIINMKHIIYKNF